MCAYSNSNPGRKSYFDKNDSIDIELELFYLELFEEAAKFGVIEEIYISDNTCDHLVGNVYIKYFREQDATEALIGINDRFFNGREIKAFLTPANNFSDAKCNKYHDISARRFGCDRKGDCNFLHLLRINEELVRILKGKQVSQTKSNQFPKKTLSAKVPEPTFVGATH